jgi:hypothetical protein
MYTSCSRFKCVTACIAFIPIPFLIAHARVIPDFLYDATIKPCPALKALANTRRIAFAITIAPAHDVHVSDSSETVRQTKLEPVNT